MIIVVGLIKLDLFQVSVIVFCIEKYISQIIKYVNSMKNTKLYRTENGPVIVVRGKYSILIIRLDFLFAPTVIAG